MDAARRSKSPFESLGALLNLIISSDVRFEEVFPDVLFFPRFFEYAEGRALADTVRGDKVLLEWRDPEERTPLLAAAADINYLPPGCEEDPGGIDYTPLTRLLHLGADPRATDRYGNSCEDLLVAASERFGFPEHPDDIRDQWGTIIYDLE